MTPRDYYYHSNGKPNPYKNHNVWQSVTVRVILQNETYLGHSVKFKKGTTSYKNKKFIRRPEDERIRCENTHTAIISKELWDATQSLRAERKETQLGAAREKPLFTGILRCADCNSGFIGNTRKQTRKDGRVVNYCNYSCCLYLHTGRSKCSSHSISELSLLEIVRHDIRRHLKKANADEERVVKKIQSRLSGLSAEEAKRELGRLTARLKELETLGAKLYEDRLNGTINLDTF